MMSQEEAKVKIEEVDEDHEEEEETDDEMPGLESANAVAEGTDDKGGKQNRAEKKARKILQKLGLKHVPGIKRVQIKKSKSVMFVINAPDVYKNPGSDSYVVFGEAKNEDPSAIAAQAVAQGLKQDEAAKAAASAPATQDDDADVDETGLKAKDIELVLQQASNISRAKAVKALRDADGDVINAIMVFLFLF